MKLHFTDYFEVEKEVLDEYGAFNISLVTDLPLFIDPFLLFNSEKPEYRQLHEGILDYLQFLRERSVEGTVNRGLLRAWYVFKEVKQNWLGFTVLGNGGSGLGLDFARALNGNLHRIFSDFGEDHGVAAASHLEKLCLIEGGVGKDNISDFTTNLIKHYLLDYTQKFAQKYISAELRATFVVDRVKFNYETQTWQRGTYELPVFQDDFVLLTPKDMLTRDDTWINRADLISDLYNIPMAIPDEVLRAQISNYFFGQLGKKPTKAEQRAAAMRTITTFPQIIDYYIKQKEESGEDAQSISAEKVELSESIFVGHMDDLIATLAKESKFFNAPLTDSYKEALARVGYLKHCIEDNDCWRLLYGDRDYDKPVKREKDLQLLFVLTWYATVFDVNREPNNGRGPVDFKVSYGNPDKSLVEFKLASNSRLEQNLEKQVEIYGKANLTGKFVKVILYFTYAEYLKVNRILTRLNLQEQENIILIDARSDNKQSASKV